MGIAGIELGILSYYDPSTVPDILGEDSAQIAVFIGGTAFAIVGTVIVLREFRGYHMCPRCGYETWDSSIKTCPKCGTQNR